MAPQKLNIAALQQREGDGKRGRNQPCMAQFRILKLRDFALGESRTVSLLDPGRNRTWFVHQTNDAINPERPEHVDGYCPYLAKSIAHRKMAVKEYRRGPSLHPKGVEPANKQPLVAIYVSNELSCRSNRFRALAADDLASCHMQTGSELRHLSTASALAHAVHPTDKDDRHRTAPNKARTFAFSASDR